MKREGLRVFLSDWCGCGSPEAASATLLRLLQLHPMYEHHAELEAWIPDAGVRYVLLYYLDAKGLTEHGVSVDGGWLTPKGKDVRDALQREADTDNFDSLHDGNFCVHGYDDSDTSHDCT